MLRIKTFLKHKLRDKDDEATKVFGVPLDPDGFEIPPFIIAALNRLRKSVDEQGLFRISGDLNEVNSLKKEFDDGHEVDLSLEGTHTVASLFKLYLRELPYPLIGYDIYDGLIATYSIEETQLRHQLIKRLIMTIPDHFRAILEHVCVFLHFVEQNNVKNKMTSNNLAIVFAPNLMRPRVETLDVIIHDAPHIQYIVRALIQECDFFFKKDTAVEPFSSTTPSPTSPSRTIILSNMRRSASSPLSSPDLSSALSSMSTSSTSPPSPPPPTGSATPQQKNDPPSEEAKEETKEEKPVAIVAQIQEMLKLAESSVRNQLLPAIDEISGKLQSTTDLEQATMLAECIRKARKLLNEGPTQKNSPNGGPSVAPFVDSPNPTFSNERLQGIKASMETAVANIKSDLLALLNEAASIPDNCRQLEAEIALGQMIYIIQLLRNVKQVLFYKESTNRVFRIRSISYESVRTLKFAALITTMMTIINVIRERIDKQPSSILLYAARAAANINSLLQAPLGSVDSSGVPSGPVLDTSDNEDAQSSLVELVSAILKEVEKGISQFAHVIDRPDWTKSKDAWHARASEILVVLESLVQQIDPSYPLELISTNNASTPQAPLSPRTRARAAPVQTPSPLPSPRPTPSKAHPDLDPPELVAKGASLTTVFTSVSWTSKDSTPSTHTPNSVPTIANARMVKSPSFKDSPSPKPLTSKPSLSSPSLTDSPSPKPPLASPSLTPKPSATLKDSPSSKPPLSSPSVKNSPSLKPSPASPLTSPSSFKASPSPSPSPKAAPPSGIVKSPSLKPLASVSTDTPSSPSTRLIRSPSYAPASPSFPAPSSSSSSPSSASPLATSPPSPLAFARTTPSTSSSSPSSSSSSSPSARRLSANANTHAQSKVVIGSGTDPAKRGPNYELLRETVRQATVKLEGLVARAREAVDTCNDVQTALRIVGSLRVVQEMMTNNFGPSSAPPTLPATPTYAFLKTAAQGAFAEISLQLRLVKDFGGESEESLFQMAKTLRNIINALHVEPPSKK